MHLQHLLMHTPNMDDHCNAPTGFRLQRTQQFVHNTGDVHTTVVVHNTNDAHTTEVMRAQQCRWRAAARVSRRPAAVEE